MRRASTVVLLCLLPSLPLLGRGLDVRDLVQIQRVSDPQVSPDSRQVAFVLRSTDLEADKGRTDLWLAVIGESPNQLTTHPASDYHPRWAADGSGLFFLSTRSGTSQVWFLPSAGGEARSVTDLPLSVGGFVISPDAQHLIVAMDVFPDCSDLDCTVQRLEEQTASKQTGVLYDQLFVRQWDTWRDGRRGHLFVVPTAGGEARDLTAGLDADAPTKPWGGMEEVVFSKDGETVVYVARTADYEEPWSTDFDLYAVPLDGSSEAVELTEENRAWDTAPTFSPDGSRLAYLAMKRAGFEADRFAVMVRDWPNGTPREVSPEWDRSAGSLQWIDDQRLLATAGNLGQVSLFEIDVESGKVETVAESGHIRSPSVLADGRILFGRDTLTMPVDLWLLDPQSGAEQQLTSVNRELLAEIEMGEAEQFSFAGWNDEKVYGYVVKPAGFQSGKKYPVAFLVHGGPQGSFGNDFHYRWNPQTYAGAEFASIMIDFHGSTGYGQSFTDSITGDWGGKPLEDLQKGLVAALGRFEWLDGERVCALGASYGGYMMNWIAGQWPDGFRCLVNHDGLFDTRAFYYETEELWFPEWEHGGPAWLNRENFEKHNPVNFVENWKTPMLVIHGELDYRVTITQGLSAFTALQRQGIPSKFLYFPDENHWVLKPNNSIQWHDTVLSWLRQWTQ